MTHFMEPQPVPAAQQPSLAPPPPPAPVSIVEPSVAVAAPVAVAPRVDSPVDLVLNSLAQDVNGFIAASLVNRVDGSLSGSATHFAALDPSAMSAVLLGWFGGTEGILAPVGGSELFGPLQSGQIVTEAAAIHIRLVGDHHALIVVTDPPAHGGVVHATLDILHAYTGALATVLTA